MLFTYPVLSNGVLICSFLLIKDRSMLLDKQGFKQNSSDKSNHGIHTGAGYRPRW